MEEQEKSLEETEDGCSPERDTKSRMIRELKSLQDSAKESKIISESTQLSSKIRKSRKDLDSPGASRPNSVASNSPQNSDKSDDKRIMRTQNSEFAAKHMMFLKNATGAKKTIATDSMSDSSQEKLTEIDCDSQLMMERDATATMSENRRNLSVVREVNGRKVDPFCWRCHTDGTTVQCSACPRSYHNKCINSKLLPQNMACWACSECSTTMNAEDIGKRTPAMEKISQTKLGTLLKFATQRMMDVKGSEPFTHPVDPVEFPDYEQYIVHPVDLEILQTKVLKNCFFGSTSAFLSETKWIVHNSIIFNTRQSKLSSVAKTILKVCKHEMGEIESCPECYLNAHTKTDCWFIQVCERPHTLLWAKLKSYPYWPGKAMAVSKDGLVDVRFFGAHDRAWVPVRNCYLYSVRDPNSGNKPKKNEILESVMEVNLHIENIRSKYRMFIYANFKTPFDPSIEDEQLKMMIPMYNGPIKSYSRVKQAPEGKLHIDAANVNMQPKVVINKQVMRVENSRILKKPPVPALLRTKSIDSGLSCGDGSQISIYRSAASHGYQSEDDSMEEANIISRAFDDEFSEVAIPILSRKRPRILSMNSTDVSKKMKPIPIQSFEAGKSKDSSADRSSMMSEYKDALRESKTCEAEKKNSNQNASPAKLSKALQNVTEVKVSNTKDSNSERNVSTFKVYPGTTKATYSKTQSGDDSNEIAQKKARLDSLAMFNNLKMNNSSLVIQHKSANNGIASVNTVSNESPKKPDQQSLITPKSLTAAAIKMAATPGDDKAHSDSENLDELIVPKEEPLDPEDIPDEGVTDTPVAETQHQLLNSLQLMPTPMPEFISANIKELTVRKNVIPDAVQPVNKKVITISELNPSNLKKTTIVNGNSSNLKESIVKIADLPIGTKELTIKKTKSSNGTRELTVNKGLNKKYKSPAELRDEGITKTVNESQSNITVKLVSSGSVKTNSIYPIDIRSLMEPPKEDNPSNVSLSKSGQSFFRTSFGNDVIVTSERNAALIDEAIATISDEALQSACENTVIGNVLSASSGNKTPSHEITVLNHQLAANPDHDNNSNRRIRGVSTKRKKKRFASLPVPKLAPLSTISTDSASVSKNNTANTVATNTEPMDNSADCLNPFNGIPSGMEFLPLPPSSAGPVHKLVNDNAFKMAAFFRQMMVSTLSDLGLKQGLSAEAAVRSMQMELELVKYNQQQFYKDIKTITEARIEEMRGIFESQTKRAVNEAKQIAELEKEAAVTNTKLHQWCAYCHNRSQFFCCWNTSYCSYQCQQNHWVSHTGFCVQTPKNGTQEPKNYGVLTATSPLPSVTNYTVREATPTSSAANDKTVSVDLEGSVVLARKTAANYVPQPIQTSKNSPMLQILEKIPRGPAQRLKPVFISRVNMVNKGNKMMTAIAGNSTMVSLPKQIITNAAGSKVIPRKLIKIVPRPAHFTSIQKKLLSPARETLSTSIQTSRLLVTKVNSPKEDSPPQVVTKDSSEPVAIITNNNDTSCLKPAMETDNNHKDVEM